MAGFTLVELGVWLVLSAIMLLAITVLFANSSRSRNEMERSTQQIENGRYALDVLRDDLQLAGYYGNAVPALGSVGWSTMVTGSQFTTPDPCATGLADLEFTVTPLRWPVAVYGYAADVATPDCITNAVPARKLNTAVLVVRRTSTLPTAAAALDANAVYVQASGCPTELSLVPSKLFVVGGGDAALYTLHSRGTAGACGPASPIYQLQTHIYYISDEAIPTLRMITVSGTSATANANVAVVEGIQDMRFEFGADTLDAASHPGGDGTADEYRSCVTSAPCDSAVWFNVTAVRVSVLARTLDPSPAYVDTKKYTLADVEVGPFNDAYRRHVFTAVVRLMNPVGWRER